jgi:hypothetical protein
MFAFLLKLVRLATLVTSNIYEPIDRVDGKGGQNMRTKATIDRLNMYKNFKPVRNRKGKLIKAAPFQSWNSSGTQARVEPNRKLKLVVQRIL